MRLSIARSLALATLVPALSLFVFVPGCAKQSEGERCGDSSGPSNNDDCGDGLTCINANLLLNSGGGHRCCYADHVTDSRCEPSSSQPSSGGASSGGSGGMTEAGGGGSGGMTEAAGAGAGAGEGGFPEVIAEAGAGGTGDGTAGGDSSGIAGGGSGGIAGGGTGGTAGGGTGGN